MSAMKDGSNPSRAGNRLYPGRSLTVTITTLDQCHIIVPLIFFTPFYPQPKNSDYMIQSNDGGSQVSLDGGSTWRHANQPAHS